MPNIQTGGAGGLDSAAVQALIDTSRAQIAYFSDQKATTVGGGTFTSGAWRTRDINTEDSDPAGLITISANQITITAAGTYEIIAICPGYAVDRHKSAIYDVTNTAYKAYGSCAFNNSTYNTSTPSIVRAVVTIAGATTYEIRHYCQTTKATVGFGISTDDGSVEKYAQGSVRRIS